MKITKKALLKSGLALLLCISVFIGTTFAWFTDSVTSGSNIIKSGNLDLEMYWTDDLSGGTWHNVEDAAHNTIFSYDNWEPGYTDVKYIKIKNNGSLALNYNLSITPENGVGKLAEVINVYYAMDKEGIEVKSRSELNKLQAVGLLNSVMNGGRTVDGTLLAANQQSPVHDSGETIVTLAMSMITSAGNDYQNETSGEFTITALATQAPFEKDSFGSDYDSNATYPVVLPSDKATVAVTPVDGRVPAGGATLQGEKVSAFVPAGAQMAQGADKLTLSVTPLEKTTSDITTVNNEILIPVDVHIEGIDENNTTPIIIDLGEILPKYLNMGNYYLFHIEDGQNKVMTLVDSKAQLTAHNTFTYNPTTGEVSVAMASFSEVALFADTDAKWDGKEDDSWYDTAKTSFEIANADQFYAFSKIVGGMSKKYERDSFSGKTVKLLSNINLNHGTVIDDGISRIFYPVGYYNNEEDKNNYDNKTGIAITSGIRTFEGTFDGNGHTIKNVYQNTWEMKGDHNWYAPEDQHYRDGMGIFGRVYGGTIKNLTVDNFKSDGEITTTGVVSAYADFGATFENIAITNCNPRVYNIGNGGIVGCVGWYTKGTTDKKVTFKNITADNTNKISALWGSYDVPCGGIVGQYYPTSGQTSAGTPKNAGIHFENCHVSAVMDVYNDVCANYQYYAYRYAGMIIGSIRENETKNGRVYPKMDGITAKGCTVNYGTWNDYYYCELVANSLASYTHDHQFSRLEIISSLDEIKKGDTWTKTGNFLLFGSEGKQQKSGEGTCYHIMKDANGNLYEHKHNVADETNKDIWETVNGEKILKENNERIYLPFHQLFTGYSWGVTSIGIEDLDGIKNITVGIGQENSEVKFESRFDTNILPRIGNGNPVKLSSIFKADDGATIVDDGVWVTLNKVNEKNDIKGEFIPNEENWGDGTIKFSGTGIVKITIQDYNFCTPTVLYVEVVNADNVTGPTDATAKNIVLLNDIGSGFTVSGDYTFYGNGFTLNYTGDGQYLNNGLKQGLVTVSENGTLDNLRIKASIYPSAYMYYSSSPMGDYVQGGPSSVEGDKTRYHYQLSSVVAKGNATISNCYIYGGRTNIFVDTGNVSIENCVLESGTVANVQIQSTDEYTVTLENVTTIQRQVKATIVDTSKVMLGAAVLVGPDTTSNPTIVLSGSFKQYNWVTEDDKEAVSSDIVKMIIDGALNATEFNHTINGKTASNLGIIYMNEADRFIKNNTGLHYEEAKVSISSVNGYAYSLRNASADQIYSDIANADRTSKQGDYLPTFNFDLGSQAISYDGSEDTRYLYGDAKGITALYQDGESPLTLDLSKLATIYKYTGLNYSYTAVCKNASGNALSATNNIVTLDAQGDYTLEFTIDDNIFYDKDGNIVNKSVNKTFIVPLKLTVKAATIKNATVSITKTALDGVYNTVNLNDYELRIKFLDCISVTDYDNKGTGTTVNLSSNISSATLTPSGVNVFTTASTITITYTDGRVLTVNLSKISGSSPGTKTGKINTSGSVYFTTEGALNNKPTEASSQNKCTITSVSYKGNSGSTVTNDTDVTVTWALGSSGGSSPCVTSDTLVTLADGTQKRIDQVTYNDQLLVWNFYEGKYDVAPVAIIFDHGADNNTIIELTFSDGKNVKVVNMHQFYDNDLHKLVTINEETVANYIGHSFAKHNAGKTDFVELISYSISKEYVEAWGIMTAGHYNIITADMISADFDLKDVELFNYFEIGEDMKFDQAKMQADIEKYGLYTYDDFSEYLTYEQFMAFNVQYFKIPVGKGLYTYDGILELIDQYLK